MRTILLAAAALGAAGAVSAQTRTDFEFRRELAAGRRFHLHNIIGDVQVTGGAGPKMHRRKAGGGGS